MACSRVCLLWYFLGLASTGWILFNFTARVVARLVGKLIKARVHFRFAGIHCLKDVSIHFTRGPLASIVVGEIQLKLPLMMLNFSALQESKLQLCFSGVDVSLQKPGKSSPGSGSQNKSRERKGLRGQSTFWPIIANCAKHVNLTVTDLAVKVGTVPKLSLVIKKLDLDTFRPEDSTMASLGVRLVLASIDIHVENMHYWGASPNGIGDSSTVESTIVVKRGPTPFTWEQLAVSSNLDYVKGRGLLIRQIEISCGEAEVNLSEELIFRDIEMIKSSFQRKHKDGSDENIAVVQAEDAGLVTNEKSSVDNKSPMVGILTVLPEKFGINLSKISFNFSQSNGVSTMKNEISGVKILNCTSKSVDEKGEVCLRCDMRFDCGEIHIVKDNEGSLLQIVRMSVVVTMAPHTQVNCRKQVEMDANLEGTRFNLFLATVDELLKFYLRLPRKSPKLGHVLDESPTLLKKKKPKWELSLVCTISAPEIGVAVYDVLGSSLLKLNSQSLQIFIDNVSGPSCRMQLEVGELHVMIANDIYRDCTSSRESDASSLINLGGLVMEWGTTEPGIPEDDKIVRRCSVIIVDCTEIGIRLSAIVLEALVLMTLGVKRQLEKIFGKKTNSASSKTSKVKRKGAWRKIEVGVQGLSIEFRGPMVVDEIAVPDPKTLNLGDQGGKVVLTHNHDGVLRTASLSTPSYHHAKESNVLFKASFDEVFGLASIDSHRKNFQFSLDRGQICHEELGPKKEVISKLTMLAVKHFEVLYEGGNFETGLPGRLLLSLTCIDGHWNPDVHLFYHNVGLHLAMLGGQLGGKSDKGAQANEESRSFCEKQDSLMKSKVSAPKQKLTLAVDLQHLNFIAQVAEELEFAVRVQSLVSEDVEIGVLVEDICAILNDSEVLHLEQAQICRLPWSTSDAVDGKTGTSEKVDWKVSVNATKLRIIMPFRLKFRAIEDAVEDMWRVLKLVMKAQKIKWKASNVVIGQDKVKKHSAQIQSVLGSVNELRFEVEEEPLQGWLDEHYHLMGREVCKLLVQERILQEKRQQKAIKHRSDAQFMPEAMDSHRFDPQWERLHKEGFRAYRIACEKLVLQKACGACKDGLQSGFQMTNKRKSLLLVRASDVEIKLSLVKGSIVETVRKLDCVSPDMQVPYARIYGRHISIRASALVAQLRDFSLPLVKTGVFECEGNVIVAQQAIPLPPQMRQGVSLGKLRTVEVWRSVSGATPAYKTFLDLDLDIESGNFSYGVGYEPAIADISYAFSVALQKAKPAIPVVKKERSLPWWDDMRYYLHGRNSLKIKGFTWSLLATTNPYEDQQLLQFVATTMDIKQSEGSLLFRADDFEWVISRSSSACQLHALADYQEKLSVLHAPEFKLEIIMDWKCESGKPLHHYLHPFPSDVKPPTKKFDLFRSTSLSLTFSFSLFCPDDSNLSKGKPSVTNPAEKVASRQVSGPHTAPHHSERSSVALCQSVPTVYFGSQELKWIFSLWNLFYSPPQKLRSFSRWPRFGVQRIPRSGNLSLDKVMTEFLLRVDATPGCIKHRSNLDADPAHGLTFHMERLRYELLYSRCQSQFESAGPREPLMSVYQGLDLSMLSAGLDIMSVPILKDKDLVDELDREDKVKELLGLQEGVIGESGSKRLNGRGFLLHMDCFTLRKQAPKAGLSQLSALLHYKRISQGDRSAKVMGQSGNDWTRSDASDDEGFNVVLADNCLRVSVYGLKLLWTLPNRDAVWSWVEDFSRAFESPRPSPSRQSAQRKMLEMKEKWVTEGSGTEPEVAKEQPVDTSEEEGVMHFMVNVVQPQFNLHSEDALGRLLLAAASGRVLARSFHSILAVGLEIIASALQQEGVPFSSQGGAPVIAWKRRELSVILEHVQAHVAPTDVDLGAGLQWLPKIPTEAPKVRRTGALLERVFMPCSMYFQYTRHKGGTTDCKVKPLKELSFNSPNITATMTSNQFHIMVDVISNLLLARLPKPRRRPSVHYVGKENGSDEEGEEEVDEVVPDGVEEVEVARIKLEQAERACHAVIGYWASMKQLGFEVQSSEMQMLEKEFVMTRRVRRLAFLKLRATLQRAAELRLMEKEKHRTPLAAMRISWAIDKFVWSMLCDGESFAEAEISSMILNVDRDFSDVGVARFTTKWFAVKNCLPGAKSSMVLSPWNPPAEWGRNVMLRVDAKQGAPTEGRSPLELFQVEIYPLKIYLTEGMYTMMWDYLFPEEDQDFVQRQTVRIQHQKVSLAVPNSTIVIQGRNTSVSRTTVDEKELEMLTDEVNARTTAFPVASILRGSMVSSVHNSSHEDLQSAVLIHSSMSTEGLKSREQKTKKGTKISFQEEKKLTEEKKVTRVQKRLLEFHNIRISQVELLVTYEGSRFSVNDMRLLMDTFTRLQFTGSWRRLFSKVKKHIIWSVLKSVTGMQGKKFKDKLPAEAQGDGGEAGEDSNSSDSSTGQAANEDQFPISHFKKHSDRAGEGFVSSIRGLFNSQRRKAKALMMRKLSMDLRNSTDTVGYVSGGDADQTLSPQELVNVSKAKGLLRRHSRKLRSSGSQKGGVFGVQSQSSSSSSPLHAEAELSDGSSTYEDFHE